MILTQKSPQNNEWLLLRNIYKGNFLVFFSVSKSRMVYLCNMDLQNLDTSMNYTVRGNPIQNIET